MFTKSITKATPHRLRAAGLARTTVLGGLLGASLVLSGCAAGDVEMNGAIFDYIGLGKAAPEKASQAPERQGLVLPPSLDRLPPPGSGAANAATTQVALPVNPEARVNAAAGQQAAEQEKYCEKALARAKLTRDLTIVQGPYGSCTPSALTALTGSNPLANAGGTHQVKVPQR
jgi:hypothetical protein